MKNFPKLNVWKIAMSSAVSTSTDSSYKVGYPRLQSFDIFTDNFPYMASYDKDENLFSIYIRVIGSPYLVREMTVEELQHVDLSSDLKDNCVLTDITGDALFSLWIPDQDLHHDFSPDAVLDTARYSLFSLSGSYVKFVGERGILIFYSSERKNIEFTGIYYPANMQKEYEVFKATILEYLNIQKAFTPTPGSDGYSGKNTVFSKFHRSASVYLSTKADGTFKFYTRGLPPSDETDRIKRELVETPIEFEEVQGKLNAGFTLQKADEGRMKVVAI